MSGPSTRTILMTADSVGGVWTYATGLASALAASGANVCLVTMGPRPRTDQRAMVSEAVRLIESDLALEWQDPEGKDIPEARQFLRDLERCIGPDLVHLNSYREASFDWRAPVVVVAHSCVNSWGVACDDQAFLSEPKWRTYSRLVEDGLDQADAWVSPTQAFAATMRGLYRPRTDAVVIRNGAAFGGAPQPKKCLMLAAGRMWDAAKNLAVLAEAAKDLDWPVLVAGSAGRSAGKPACRIELLGELSHAELSGHMQRAAIFVSPARYEPFGLSVLEAAGAGCALVLSDIATFRELWDGAALFVAPDDADGLRRALDDLCNDPLRRTRLQRASHARARRYSIKSMTEVYVRLYRSLLSPKPTADAELVEVRT
ncbi:MAG: glycosyltransferase family 4 protein [Bradyrhizobium sp.]|nr:glycosyltransferase family 4 protein [Bradyrhizobium sp.]